MSQIIFEEDKEGKIISITIGTPPGPPELIKWINEKEMVDGFEIQ